MGKARVLKPEEQSAGARPGRVRVGGGVGFVPLLWKGLAQERKNKITSVVLFVNLRENAIVDKD